MHYINRSSHLGNLLLLFIFSFLSVFCFLLLITDNNRPVCYESLCILPLSFTIFSWIFYKIYFFIVRRKTIWYFKAVYNIRLIWKKRNIPYIFTRKDFKPYRCKSISAVEQAHMITVAAKTFTP